MGWADAFDYPNAASIFREYAAQTGFENNGARVLDISEHSTLSDADYDAAAPFVWGGSSPFAGHSYSTPDGKARMVPVKYAARDDGSRSFALRLNTGRYRDQWHTMTRTGLSPKLSQHRREPLVEVHPDTIQRFGLCRRRIGRSGDRLAANRCSASPALMAKVGRKSLCRCTGPTRPAAAGRTGLLPSQDRDPVSGQPGFKNTAATIRPIQPAWTGFLVTREQTALPDCSILDPHPDRAWLADRIGGRWRSCLARRPVARRRARRGARPTARRRARSRHHRRPPYKAHCSSPATAACPRANG